MHGRASNEEEALSAGHRARLRKRLLDAGPDGYVVTVSGPGRAHHTGPEPEVADAYARALLYVVRSPMPSAG